MKPHPNWRTANIALRKSTAIDAVQPRVPAARAAWLLAVLEEVATFGSPVEITSRYAVLSRRVCVPLSSGPARAANCSWMVVSTCGGVNSLLLLDGSTLKVMLVPTLAEPLLLVAPPNRPSEMRSARTPRPMDKSASSSVEKFAGSGRFGFMLSESVTVSTAGSSPAAPVELENECACTATLPHSSCSVQLARRRRSSGSAHAWSGHGLRALRVPEERIAIAVAGCESGSASSRSCWRVLVVHSVLNECDLCLHVLCMRRTDWTNEVSE